MMLFSQALFEDEKCRAYTGALTPIVSSYLSGSCGSLASYLLGSPYFAETTCAFCSVGVGLESVRRETVRAKVRIFGLSSFEQLGWFLVANVHARHSLRPKMDGKK